MTFSFIFLAWQTLQLRRQVRITGVAANYNSHLGVTQMYHDVFKLIISRPHLMPYFLSGKACPPDDPNRVEALVVADMMANVHELGLQHTREMPDAVHGECWPASAVDSLRQPILKELFLTPQPWYPELRMLFERGERANRPAADPIGTVPIHLAMPQESEPQEIQPGVVS
ncbi:hypothetical protein ACFQFC_06070 [Amorphoplanes digitatis]|uniref:Uncharacterized protein n=1 Tax=Actinoplanes digitatis TaxID=1868 RepID=A0A7W7MR05_9ACTN|nr:hypothetical protein [Actinoplanes digitatis]MBB4763761.1 hypothetical protein [Actinoplanes digitatis]GID92980.1 hypothetical protein Adi01nite_23920 [Actinoplanes digitatis]